MHTEDFIVDKGSYGHEIEAIRKLLPNLDIVPSFALIVEAIDPVYRRALVIASQQEKVLGVFDFISEQKTNSFN